MAEFDIFLSYNWNIQTKAKEIFKRITKWQVNDENFFNKDRLLRVWMDVDQMNGGQYI